MICNLTKVIANSSHIAWHDFSSAAIFEKWPQYILDLVRGKLILG